MGNLDSKLSIAHFSHRRNCRDVWLDLALTLTLTLTWCTVPGSVCAVQWPETSHRWYWMWFSCKLGLLGASLSPNAHGKQTARCWGNLGAWSCGYGHNRLGLFYGAKGSITVWANLTWVLVLSYAKSSWKGTIQKPGKGPSGQGRPRLW